MRQKMVLFLSNGYAEDNIACCIIEELIQLSPSVVIKAMPFVGEGAAYKSLEIPILGPSTRMPSDGFISGNFLYFLRDIQAGWLGAYREKIRALRAEKNEVEVCVCVGDVFLLISWGIFARAKRPTIFLPTAKSDYIKEHYFLEKCLMRRFCTLVCARDGITALSLEKSGVPASYVGNVMMDCLHITGESFGIKKEYPTVAIVPGSKQEAYCNLSVCLKAAQKISQRMRANFLVALSPSLEVQKIKKILPRGPWRLQAARKNERGKGIVARIVYPKMQVKIIQGRFGDVVDLSSVVIGTAGMANEQAVGLGKPVISFPGRGPQMTEKFLRAQQKLLGGALFVVEPCEGAIANKVCSLLADSDKLKAVEKIGQNRMGGPGGARKIAQIISRRVSGI